MTKVFIYRGIQGSGKTTLAKKRGISYYFSTDDFWMKDGKYEFDPARIGEAHAWNFKRFLDFLHVCSLDKFQGGDAVIDNTNITAVELAPYVQACLAYGVDYEIITVWCDPEVAIGRNVHAVPPLSIMKRYAQLLKEELPPHWKQSVVFNS